MPKAKPQEKPMPDWAAELSEKYQSGIAYAFIVHGNVQDYVGGDQGVTLKQYLLASFAERDIVIYWNSDSGFYIPPVPTTEEQPNPNLMRERFVEIVGLQPPAQQQPRGGIAAGLNALQQQGVVSLLEKVRNPALALEYLSKLLRYRPPKRKEEKQETLKIAVIIDYAEYLVPETTGTPSEADRSALVTLSEWGRDPVIANNNAIITMIAAELTELNERLRRSGVRWEQIEIPLPDFDERAGFIQQLVAGNDDVSMADGFSFRDFSRLTTGLRYIDLEDIVLRASFHHEPISRSVVKKRKTEIMKSEYADLLQVEESDFGFEAIGGMVELKQELMDTVIHPMRDGKYWIVPQGVLFLGPPGTGKTTLARALSKEAGFTFAVLNFAKIMLRYVGDTERRLARALYAIKQMAPCMVFIDEIDQSVQRGESGDSGVNNRMFKQLMEFMSDTSLRGRVLFIAATNRPDLMDKALLRPGRFDRKFPFFVPTNEERADILSILTSETFGEANAPTHEMFLRLAKELEEYPGAELENIIVKAASVFERSHGTTPVVDALKHAVDVILPSTGDIEAMTRLALLYCNDLDLVPERYREIARQLRHPAARKQLQEELEQEDVTTYSRRRREL